MHVIHISFSLSTSADRRGDRHHPEVDSERTRVPSLHAKNPPGHQGRKHPAQHRGARQTSGLWSRRTTDGNINDFFLHFFNSNILHSVFQTLRPL